MDEDFIEGEKSRTVSKMTIKRREKNSTVQDGLCSLDMRINKLELDEKNNATIELLFNLDYYPETSNDVYTIFLVHNISVYDRNRVLQDEPTSDLSVGYMTMHYIESSERLFNELRTQSEKMRLPIKGDFKISRKEAEDQIEITMKNYYR